MRYSYITLAATIFLGIMFAWGIMTESYLLAVVGLVIALPVVYISKTKSREKGEVIEDELTSKVAKDSAMVAFVIVLPIIAILSVMLIIGGDSIGEWAEYAGYTLSLTTCAFVFVYIGAALIFNRRLVKE